ncbi:MAG: hypothetical protein MUD12_17200 [Spirochaetes bacterium]|jgi:hypothetical protein|nr:hypothetical protein [Spirochaetota bacterium]
MKKMKKTLLYFMIAMIPCMVFADQATNMMGEYMKMGEGTEKNFPKELESLLPKGFTVSSKKIVYKETQNMFLCIGLNGTMKNPRQGGTEAEIQIGIMAYNPKTAGYMSAQWPYIAQETRKNWKMDSTPNSSDWEYGPVAVTKAGIADVNYQKATHKNIELDNNTMVQYVYHNGEAMMFNKNMMLQIRLLFYPEKSGSILNPLKEIVTKVTALNLDKYMK